MIPFIARLAPLSTYEVYLYSQVFLVRCHQSNCLCIQMDLFDYGFGFIFSQFPPFAKLIPPKSPLKIVFKIVLLKLLVLEAAQLIS